MKQTTVRYPLGSPISARWLSYHALAVASVEQTVNNFMRTQTYLTWDTNWQAF